MKVKLSPVFSTRTLLMLLLLVALALGGCERPLRDEVAPTATSPRLPGGLPGLTPMPGETPTIGLPPVIGGETPLGGEPTAGPSEAGTPGAGGIPGTETTPAPPAATEPARTTEVEYLVAPGDTLASIAQRFGVAAEEIAARNSLPSIHQITAGQTLIIPVPGSTAGTTGERIHVVQPGDNLFRIGLQYGFTAEEIAAYNNISVNDTIYVGQAIRIPPSG